jgi:peroxiredoxin
MAQLRHDYQEFKALNAEVFVIVPNGPKTIARFVTDHPTPYPILSDKGSKVAAQYHIAIKHLPLIAAAYFKPSVFLVDKTGKIIYTNYHTSYIKEPDNREPLAVLARLPV